MYNKSEIYIPRNNTEVTNLNKTKKFQNESQLPSHHRQINNNVRNNDKLTDDAVVTIGNDVSDGGIVTIICFVGISSVAVIVIVVFVVVVYRNAKRRSKYSS